MIQVFPAPLLPDQESGHPIHVHPSLMVMVMIMMMMLQQQQQQRRLQPVKLKSTV